LQATNEELITVNQEMKSRVEELGQANSDLQNLMASTNIATIFLDRSLNIKRYTPPAMELFNLVATDEGRPLSMFRYHLQYDDLAADAMRVLERLTPVEREVASDDGRWFLARVQPYRTIEDSISGVVLTFVDITERRAREEDTRELAHQLEQQGRIFNTTLTSISDFAYIFDRDGRFRYSNNGLLNLLGLSAEEIAGKNFFDLGYPADLAARLQRQIQQVFETQQSVRDETPFVDASGATGFYEYIFTPGFDGDGNVEFVAGSTRDVTERKNNELKLQQSQTRLQKALEIGTVGVIFFNMAGEIVDTNSAFEQMSGFSRQELTSRDLNWTDFTPAEWMDASHHAFNELKETGRTTPYEKEYIRKDGSRFWGVFAASQIGPDEAVEYILDITDRVNITEAVRQSEAHFRAIVNQNLAWHPRIGQGRENHFPQRRSSRVCWDMSAKSCSECRRSRSFIRRIGRKAGKSGAHERESCKPLKPKNDWCAKMAQRSGFTTAFHRFWMWKVSLKARSSFRSTSRNAAMRKPRFAPVKPVFARSLTPCRKSSGRIIPTATPTISTSAGLITAV
jgi:two-component system CheB/CheR fusion protein